MAQVDYFLKIDGIDGESVDDQFPKWIQIKSWSPGAANTGTHGGRRRKGEGIAARSDHHRRDECSFGQH